MNHQIVTRHPLRDTPWFRVVVVVVVLLLGIGVYRLGMIGGAVTLVHTEQALAKEKALSVELSKTNDQLRGQVAMLQRGRDVEQVAYQQLKNEMAVTQDEILELKEELSFYRGVVSKKDAIRGLKVQNFDLTPDEKPNAFHFKLVLTQILKNVTVARGHVRLSVEGMTGGVMKSFDYTDVALDKADANLDYRFKYFQNLEGAFSLPDDFKPTRVIVTLIPKGRSGAKVERAFAWPKQES